eukprot:scaffold242142_cov17-Tisochrysis_lutea.AAC.1
MQAQGQVQGYMLEQGGDAWTQELEIGLPAVASTASVFYKRAAMNLRKKAGAGPAGGGAALPTCVCFARSEGESAPARRVIATQRPGALAVAAAPAACHGAVEQASVGARCHTQAHELPVEATAWWP